MSRIASGPRAALVAVALLAVGCSGGAKGVSTTSSAGATTTDRGFCDRVTPADLASLGIAATPVMLSLATLNTKGLEAGGVRYVTACGWGGTGPDDATVSVAVGAAIAPRTVADMRAAAESEKGKGIGQLVPVGDVGFFAFSSTEKVPHHFSGGVFVGDRFATVQGVIPKGALAHQADLVTLFHHIAGS